MRSISLGEAKVQAGKVGIGNIPVTRMARGETLKIPVHIVNGKENGPVLGIIATIHGDAAFGILAIRELLQRLKPAKMAGAVLAMPVANPVAFESFTRVTGAGMNTDKTNLNRVFPGQIDGWLTEQIAYHITKHFVNQVDYLIDFHSSGSEGAIDYTRIDLYPENEEHNKRVFDVSKVFGYEILYVKKGPKEFLGTLTGLAAEKGIPAILAETGASDFYWRTEYLEKAVRGMMNVMKHIGILEGKPILPREQILLRSDRSPRPVLRPRHGGLFIPGLDPSWLGKIVKKGTVLGRVISPYTFEVLDELVAPFDKSVIIMMRHGMSRVNPGDYAYTVGDASKAEILRNGDKDL